MKQKGNWDIDMNDKVYGVGIIGFGFIGKVHAYGYLNMPLFYDPPPLKTRLVGVCTSKKATAEKAKNTLNFSVATTDFRRLIERKDIDIINICTPNVYHRDAILHAIKYNKHIYCDKPMVMNDQEAGEVLMSLKGYKGVGQMTLQNRFFPATMRARELIEEGFLGKVLSFRASYLHSGSSDPNKPIGWKEDRRFSGGGVLLDLGSHIIDLIYYLLGDFKEILAENTIAFKRRPVKERPGRFKKVNSEEMSLLLVRMKKGALGVIEASKIATGTNDELRFEIHGEKGALRFNLMDPNWLEVYDATEKDKPMGGERGFKKIETVQSYPSPAGFPGPKFSIGWIRSHMGCLYNFLDCIAKGKKAEPSLAHGARLQFIMEKAYESFRKRHWVKI